MTYVKSKDQKPEKDDYLILLDKRYEKYIYVEKYKILIPFKQDFIERYKADEKIPLQSITLNEVYMSTQLLDEKHAVDVFQKLSMIEYVNYWKINQRIWKLSQSKKMYDKGILRTVGVEETGYLLRCIYLKNTYMSGISDMSNEIVWSELGLSFFKKGYDNSISKPEIQKIKETKNISKQEKKNENMVYVKSKDQKPEKDDYLILLDKRYEKYIYVEKYKILIPFKQDFTKRYKADEKIPLQPIFLKEVCLGTKLLDEKHAVDVFQKLSMIEYLDYWKINQRIWKLSQSKKMYDKGMLRTVGVEETGYLLRCIYLENTYMFDIVSMSNEIIWSELGLSFLRKGYDSSTSKPEVQKIKETKNIPKQEKKNENMLYIKSKNQKLIKSKETYWNILNPKTELKKQKECSQNILKPELKKQKETKNILKQKGNGKNMQNPKEDDYVILKDKENEKYIYSKKYKILIPFKQDFNKCYEPDHKMVIKSIFLGGFYWNTKLPNEYCAVDIFQNLAMLKECNYWKINERVWKLSTTNWVYDKGKLKSDNKEKVFLLRCIYLQDKYVFYEDTKDEIVWIKLGLSPVKEDNAGVLNLKPEVQQENKTNNTSKANKYSPDIDKLLKCDYNRCQLAPYEHGILFDIKKGHWDIYGLENIKSKYKREDMVGRDPRKDIKKEGVVGIDFGTKSTVVAIQDGTNRIVPVRIGTGKLKDQIKASDYENPTIIECNDLQSFLKAYEGKQGRPETSCDDFFISYYAYSDYCVCPPKEFYAYYSDIKQWSDGKKGDVIVQDKKNKIYKFSTESSMKKECINPIELYAYYIGMYINNMRNGIYMKYLLSYPVGYSKETRELILKSFEKGIKKSFPAAVLEDAGCMKNFSVKLGISEPAAYAVTALELSGLDPKDENESYMYGIFDFGGGTTDFDFGSWRGASEEEYEVEGYDYVLECFGADSDKTLGGENILEMLAYTVFKDNTGIARDKRLVCSLPVDENAFLGSEMLISDSQIAMRNMSILKEELRTLWHQEEGWEEKYKLAGEETDSDKGLLEITLYNTDGEKIPNCKLSVDVNKLLDLIKARIKKGIDAFFRCLERTFKYSERAREENRKVYIFLAGNSCKSKFVKEIFEGNIQEYYETFKKMRPDAGKSYFELIEPLEDKPDGLSYIPNGKTSVAYGLVKSRAGSTIKIVKNYETNSDEETRFKYYLGRERRRTFDCKLSPAKTEYNEWVQFQGSVKPVIRIYYTTNPMADSERDKLNIEDIKYKEIEIQPEKGKFLFIRTVKPAVIEYVVACDIEDISSDTIAGQIDLDI